ncbi:hypothetical protein D3C81_1892580 [compost metagenome]
MVFLPAFWLPTCSLSGMVSANSVVNCVATVPVSPLATTRVDASTVKRPAAGCTDTGRGMMLALVNSTG